MGFIKVERASGWHRGVVNGKSWGFYRLQDFQQLRWEGGRLLRGMDTVHEGQGGGTADIWHQAVELQ